MTTLADRIRASVADRQDLQVGIAAAAKLAKQKINALEIFRPTKYQEEVVLSEASEILVQGAPRSGKSTIVAAMFAAYLTKTPITFSDGSKHHTREPGWMDRPVNVWLIGLQLNHVGQTIYRLLCKPGAFDIVRDKTTGLWRCWQPGVVPGDDETPVNERKPAPPFIPPSMIAKESWANKAAFQFESLTMVDGSTVYAFASSGAVKRGDPVNLAWVDEEIENSEHYPEWQSRLSDRKGRIFWTSWPDASTPALLNLYRRCEAQREEFDRGERKKLDVTNFKFTSFKNPFIDEDEKRKRQEGWTEEQILARAHGEFVVGNILAYPEFNKRYHVVDYGDYSPLNDKVTEAMRKLNWNVPPDWCVDIILDPGTARPALLWVATPPPEFWDEGEPYHIAYQELAAPRIDAAEMARRAKAFDPTRVYARFIGDSKAGNQVPMGFSFSVFEQYQREFRRQGLRCQLTGDMFLRGETVWITRSMKLRALMRTRACGRPRFRVVPHRCPTLVKQLETVVKKVTKEDVQDKLAEGQIHDVLDCGEYYAGFDPTYLAPIPGQKPIDPGMAMYEADNKRMKDLFKTTLPDMHSKKIILGVP
jgi:hypothetical protein